MGDTGGPSVLLCYVSSHIRCHNTRDSGSRPAGAVSGKPAWLYPGCFLPGPSKASSSGGPRALRKGAAGASQSIALATGSLPLPPPSTKQPVGPGQEGISRELPRQPIPRGAGLVPNRAHATACPQHQPLWPHGRDEVRDQRVLECSSPGQGGLKSSSLTLLTHSRGTSWPHLVDVKANGQIFTLAIPAGRLFWPLLDADQHFIFWLLDIKDVLQGWPRKRDTQ